MTDQNEQELDLFPEEAEASALKLGLCNDRVFRAIFANENNRDLLKILLNVVLKEAGRTPVKEVRIKNPFLLGEWNDLKEGILDVYAVDENGREFDVEMQLTRHNAFTERFAYYGAKLYSQELVTGDPWEKLKPVISVIFVNFPIEDSAPDVWFDVWSFKSELETGLGSDIITTIFVRLPKSDEWNLFPENAFSEQLRSWVRILACYPRISRDEVARLENTTEGFGEMRKKYTKYSRAPWAREMVDAELARQAFINSYLLQIQQKDREIESKDLELRGFVESQKKRLLKAIRNRFGVELAETPSYAEGKTAEELGDLIDSAYENASYEEFLASIQNDAK
ncbi:MAG: Rpn family recombination-promoting nuclease/putative transposase [Thermoguttaceae bacterium]|nr:Rpn family recombination-promoting nuclease/putative transposase [Thermoguttaceae bacterium]